FIPPTTPSRWSAPAGTAFPPARPTGATSTWKSAPSATPSTPASRSWWTRPAGWSVSSANTAARQRNNGPRRLFAQALPQRRRDGVGMLLDRAGRSRLDHHPRQLFGPGITHQHPSAALELGFGGADGGLNGIELLQRAFARHAHVHDHLRHLAPAVAQRAQGFAPPRHQSDGVEGGQQAVAGGGLLQEDDVAAGFAPQARAALAHGLEHVFVARRGTNQLDALGLKRVLEAQVGHHRAHLGR